MTVFTYAYPAGLRCSFTESAVAGFVGQTPLLWIDDDPVRATVTAASPIFDSQGRVFAAELTMVTDVEVLALGAESLIRGSVEIDTLP